MSHVVGRREPEAEPAWARSFEGTPYRYVQLLGRGGMGAVFEAEHRTLGTRVAVKLLHAELAARADLVDRLRLEAQTLARLAHPNVVSVSDLGRTHDGLAYYVMEKLEGRTLRAELDARGALDVQSALSILLAVLEALAAAHALGIVHRDVKPENVFLTEPLGGARRVKLLDFGIAKVLAESAEHAPAALAFATREELILGTPLYLAPEQIAGGPITPAVDVYASALLFYRMVSGRHPFEGRPKDAMMRAHLEEIPAPLTSARPALAAAVAWGLAKDPAARPSDARAMIAALTGAEVPASGAPAQRPAAVTAQETAETVVRARPLADPRALYMPQNATLPSTPLDVRTAEISARTPSTLRWMGAIGLATASVSVILRAQAIASAQQNVSASGELLAVTFGTHAADAAEILRASTPFANARHGILLASSALLAVVSLAVLRAGDPARRLLRAWAWLASVLVALALALDVGFVARAQVALAGLMAEGVGGASQAFVTASTAVMALWQVGFLAVCFHATRSRGER